MDSISQKVTSNQSLLLLLSLFIFSFVSARLWNWNLLKSCFVDLENVGSVCFHSISWKFTFNTHYYYLLIFTSLIIFSGPCCPKTKSESHIFSDFEATPTTLTLPFLITQNDMHFNIIDFSLTLSVCVKNFTEARSICPASYVRL